MSIEASLFTILTTYSALSALIGSRVYTDVLQQGSALPALVYQRISTPRVQAFGSAQKVIVSRPRFQFSCWAQTPDDALAVIAQVRPALLASSYAVTLDNEFTMRDADSLLYRRNLDAFIGHVGQ